MNTRAGLDEREGQNLLPQSGMAPRIFSHRLSSASQKLIVLPNPSRDRRPFSKAYHRSAEQEIILLWDPKEDYRLFTPP